MNNETMVCDATCEAFDKARVWGVYQLSTTSWMEDGSHALDRTFRRNLTLREAVNYAANLDMIGWVPGSHGAPGDGVFLRDAGGTFDNKIILASVDDGDLEAHLEEHAQFALEEYWDRYAQDEFKTATVRIKESVILVGERDEIENSIGELWDERTCVVGTYDTSEYEDDDDAVRAWVATCFSAISYDSVLRWPDYEEIVLTESEGDSAPTGPDPGAPVGV